MTIKNWLLVIIYTVIIPFSIIYAYIFHYQTTNTTSKVSIILINLLIFLIYISYVSYLIIKDKKNNWYAYISYLITGISIAIFTYSITKIYNVYQEEETINHIKSIVKHIGVILLGVSIVFGVMFISSKSRFMAIVFSLLMLLICIGFLLYSGYKYYKLINPDNDLKNKNTFLATILITILNSKAYNTINDGVTFLINSLKTARKEVLIILTLQILFITGYLLMPTIKNMIFNDINSDKLKQMKKDRSLREITIDNSLKRYKDDLEYLKKYPKKNIWDDVFEESDNLFSKNDKQKIIFNDAELKAFLLKNKFVSTEDDPTTDASLNTLINFKRIKKIYDILSFKKIFSLEEASEYIKANTQLIINLEGKIKKLEAEKNLLKNSRDSLIKMILKDPVYTNKFRKIPINDIDLGASNYNYSISSWFFIHQVPPNAKITSNKYTSILNYNNKPNILLKSNENKLKITFDGVRKNKQKDRLLTDKIILIINNLITQIEEKRITKSEIDTSFKIWDKIFKRFKDRSDIPQYFKDFLESKKDTAIFKLKETETEINYLNRIKKYIINYERPLEQEEKVERTIEILNTDKIKLQKWNNIVINYNSGTLDIFINGKMVATDTSIMKEINSSYITIGQEQGVDGGICNIVYYPKPLSINEIGALYNLLKDKSPPIF